ncbi:MAG: GNAT family N-acetyltransferase [Phycisphaeraceae bacterium]|nr:GNAT family N-acetyltransferase [Phycisphaeraceae bacterium]
MAQLPPAPDDLAFASVVLRCDRIVMALADPSYVPYYHFHIHNTQGAELGHINFRVGDTEHIRKVAGHIGYAIHSEQRGNGYAAQACEAIRPWVRHFYDEVWITCDPQNIASRRTIEKLDTRYVDTIDIPEHEKQYQLGTRQKCRYRWRV